MIGVWDTVGSIGVAAGDIGVASASSTFDYLQTGPRIHILNGYHALAIDEHRAKFAPTLWDIHRRDTKAVVATTTPACWRRAALVRRCARQRRRRLRDRSAGASAAPLDDEEGRIPRGCPSARKSIWMATT